MDPSELLNQQYQLDFKSVLIQALNVSNTLGDEVKSELGKLTGKKIFLLDELKKAWNNRKAGTYFTTGKIIEINLEHVKN